MCSPSKSLSKKQNAEIQKVENCRKDWQYSNLINPIEIKLLHLDKKGAYDMTSWPNLFIGITQSGDTIGIVEKNSESSFKKGESIRFNPGIRDSSIASMLGMDEPVFRVAKKSKENNLYCAIKMIYFANIQ